MFYAALALGALVVVYAGLRVVGTKPSEVWKAGIAAIKAWWANFNA